MCVYVQKDVAVKVGDAVQCQPLLPEGDCEHLLVAVAATVVGHHVQTPGVEDLLEPLDCLPTLRTGNLSLHNGRNWLVREEGLRAIGGGR